MRLSIFRKPANLCLPYFIALYPGVFMNTAALREQIQKAQQHEKETGLLTRQFSYNTLINLRPRESRWRPYVSVGPVLQLINLSDSPFKKARGLFRFGLNNVGILQAAYNFGNAAPLEGGGIFQLGMQGGAGFKYRVAPRWTMHVDYRGTVSPSPDFLRKSLRQSNIVPIEDGAPQFKATPSLQQGILRQQRFTGGFSFTF